MERVKRFYQRHAHSSFMTKASSAVAACRTFASCQRRERGQTLLEFAFVTPIIMVLLLGLVDFGIAVDRREVLQHAVREGARHAAVGNSVADIQSYTADQAQDLLVAADVSVCYVDMDGDLDPGGLGDNVRVSANFTYKFTGSFDILTAFGVPQSALSIDMNPSADMRMETTVAGAAACP
jgi:Flp pilus assembly protein TadG